MEKEEGKRTKRDQTGAVLTKTPKLSKIHGIGVPLEPDGSSWGSRCFLSLPEGTLLQRDPISLQLLACGLT